MAVDSVTLLRNGKEEDYKTDAVFVAIGDDPSNELAKEVGVDLDEDGYIITDKNQATNVEGVFSAGDITGGVKQWIVACGEGAVAAISAYNYINLWKVFFINFFFFNFYFFYLIGQYSIFLNSFFIRLLTNNYFYPKK